MASANDSATCTTTRELRKRFDDPASPRPACFRASLRSTFDACHAGLTPKRKLESSETPMTKMKTLQFTWISARRGRPTCMAVAWVSMRVPMTASSNPSAPPAKATTLLSSRSCRAILARVAPSAERTAISRCRAVARASIRLATLAQAISSTSETAPIRK